MTRLKRLSLLCMVLVVLFVTAQPSHSLVPPDAKGINDALAYGMRHGGAGLYSILGPNWVEGPEGALLNIYTPFMMLATKSARGGYPTRPTAEDIKNARKRYGRDIRAITPARDPVLVKFSVSLYGDDTYFARKIRAEIVGYGRGKKFKIRPKRVIQQKFAKEIPNAELKPFEAINAYYFDFERISHMDEIHLILMRPDEEDIVFKIQKDRIY